MYHIKSDKRSQKSAKLICEGLADLLKYKEYSEISISELCTKCAIARTTFYRLFDTIDDILLYQFDSLFEESIQNFQKSKKQDKSYARLILHTALNNPILTSLLINSGRTDLFDFSTRLNEDVLINSLDLNINEETRRYCTPILNAIVFAAIRTWLSNGCVESADELYRILRENISLIKNYV